jgi:hypothetical protein
MLWPGKAPASCSTNDSAGRLSATGGEYDLRRDRQVTWMGLAALLGATPEVDYGRDRAGRDQVRDRGEAARHRPPRDRLHSQARQEDADVNADVNPRPAWGSLLVHNSRRGRSSSGTRRPRVCSAMT